MATNTMQSVSAAVRGRRKRLGLSQDALARRAGVSRKFVSELEAGKATIETGRLLSVLNALDLVIRIAPVAPVERGDSDQPAAADRATEKGLRDLDAVLEDYLAGRE